MAYKQSPFPMIAGTSPVKGKLRLLRKGYQAVKSLFTKSKPTITKIPGPGASLTEISQSGMSATQRVQRNLQLTKSTKGWGGINPSKDVVNITKGGSIKKIGSGKYTSGSVNKPVSTATKHYVKYDPSSKHLRFKTNLSSKGGTTTSEFVAVKGTPGTKNFGFDFSRKMNVTPQQSKDLDKIIKIYRPK